MLLAVLVVYVYFVRVEGTGQSSLEFLDQNGKVIYSLLSIGGK